MTAEAIDAGMRMRIGKKYTFDVMVKKSRWSTEPHSADRSALSR